MNLQNNSPVSSEIMNIIEVGFPFLPSVSSSPRQNIDFPLPCPLEVFEMLVVPEQTYPLICVAVSKGTELNQVVRFGTVNPNSTSSWFTEAGEKSSVLLN